MAGVTPGADAAGCARVVLSENSADCFSPKAVRASMGSLFHLPVIRTDLAAYAAGYASRGGCVACADVAGSARFALDAKHTCLVIGNEARGISQSCANLASMRLKLPMRGGAESLNASVAAGIMMYELMKNRA